LIGICILHNSRCQLPYGSCRNCLVLRFSLLHFLVFQEFWFQHVWVPLKLVPEYASLFHYPSCTDSIKPSPSFSCNFVVINASMGWHFIQIFFWPQSVVKAMTVTHFTSSFIKILLQETNVYIDDLFLRPQECTWVELLQLLQHD
jgi:hypothetical protein